MSYFTSTQPITSDSDIIDSREINERIEYLAGLIDDDDPDMIDDDERAELALLLDLREAGSTLEDWEHGVTLVRDSYFTTYAEELADELGLIDREARWPANHIDWESAAEELQHDYTSLTFDEVDYWAR